MILAFTCYGTFFLLITGEITTERFLQGHRGMLFLCVSVIDNRSVALFGSVMLVVVEFF